MRKSIVLVTNSFPYGKGEQFVFDELIVLSEFHDITIIPLFSNQQEIFYLLPPSIRVLEPICDFDFKDKRKLLLKGFFNFCPFFFSVTEFFKKLVFANFNHFRNWLSSTLIARIVCAHLTSQRIIEDIENADIFYFYWGDTAANSVPMLKSKFPGIKIFVKFHGSDLYEYVKYDYIPFRTALLKNLDFALFISDHGADYLIKKYSKIKFSAKVFRLGVFQFGQSKYSNDSILRIVTCSSLIPLKRIDILISALKQILDFEVEWTHLGDGPLKNQLIESAKNLPQNIKYNFKGNLSRTDLINFYLENPVDLFVNVSKSEGVPVSIMEAVSFGIPVIATNVGGTSEIVNNELGYLIDENITPEKLSILIQSFYHRNDKSSFRAKAEIVFNEKCNARLNYSKLSTFIEQIDDL